MQKHSVFKKRVIFLTIYLQINKCISIHKNITTIRSSWITKTFLRNELIKQLENKQTQHSKVGAFLASIETTTKYDKHTENKKRTKKTDRQKNKTDKQ